MQQEIMRIIRKKYTCLLLLLTFLCISYFLVPLIIAVSNVNTLQKVTLGGVPIIWIYTFLQIPFTWLLGWIYYHYSKKIDEKIEELLRKGEL